VKIAIVPSWYSSDRAPSRGSFVKEQAMALVRRGHSVSVIAFDRDASGPVLRMRYGVEDGVPHVRIAVPSPWHRLLGFYAPKILAHRLAAVLREERADIVHAHAVRPAGVVVNLALANSGSSWCLTEHSGPLRAFWWTAHGHRQMDHAYAAAGRLFGVSASLVREMNCYFPRGGAQAQVLYNGIDTDMFCRSNSPPRAPGARLLFVGSLVEGKGVLDLLGAVSALPQYLDWSLSLVGAGPEEKALRVAAEERSISDRLRWLGSVPRDSMPSIYAKHDLLVVPSKAETFSLVSAEALACGVPVVATRCGGPEEVIGPLGLPLVAPGDVAALSEAILGMLGRLSSFDRQAAAKSIEQRFSMAGLAARLETIYAEMVREPK